TVAGGDGFYTRQDPTDWAIVYGESQDGNMTRHDLRNGTQKSIRPTAGRGGGGRGGPPNVVNAPPNVEAFRFYWNAPIEVSPHNPAKLYMAAQYFFKSTDRGDSW